MHNIGIVVIDGSGCTFGILKKDCHAKSLDKVIYPLPYNYSIGATILQKRQHRKIKREKYFTDCVNKLKWVYQGDNTISILFVAGLANFKDRYISLIEPNYFQMVGGLVDVQYGGENGLYQAEQLIKEGKFREPKLKAQKALETKN